MEVVAVTVADGLGAVAEGTHSKDGLRPRGAVDLARVACQPLAEDGLSRSAGRRLLLDSTMSKLQFLRERLGEAVLETSTHHPLATPPRNVAPCSQDWPLRARRHRGEHPLNQGCPRVEEVGLAVGAVAVVAAAVHLIKSCTPMQLVKE